MSFSYTESGEVKAVKDNFKATYAANPLDEPERSLRQKAENCLSAIENKLGADWPVNFSASGSQTEDVNGDIVDVSVSIVITTV